LLAWWVGRSADNQHTYEAEQYADPARPAYPLAEQRYGQQCRHDRRAEIECQELCQRQGARGGIISQPRGEGQCGTRGKRPSQSGRSEPTHQRPATDRKTAKHDDPAAEEQHLPNRQ